MNPLLVRDPRQVSGSGLEEEVGAQPLERGHQVERLLQPEPGHRDKGQLGRVEKVVQVVQALDGVEELGLQGREVAGLAGQENVHGSTAPLVGKL